jgi:hypothetical protein
MRAQGRRAHTKRTYNKILYRKMLQKPKGIVDNIPSYSVYFDLHGR